MDFKLLVLNKAVVMYNVALWYYICHTCILGTWTNDSVQLNDLDKWRMQLWILMVGCHYSC